QESGNGTQAQKERNADGARRLHDGRFVTEEALTISATIASERSPPMGKTICKWPAASMMSVRKLWLKKAPSRSKVTSDWPARSRILSSGPVRKLQCCGSYW